ncbi:MAG: RecX family transcriptional regulator, partial [Proteobacteria bacterium]|nr:RecX family transcriptional regulator [Pseudomonadota bacterium]
RAATPKDADADGPADPDSDAEAAVDELLDALAADGYLDETRFVESRLHVRAERFGSQRIQQELARHGLKLDAEQQAVLRASELDRARSVWLKRFGDQPPREPAEQARQTRFLLARGFAPDVVRRLLRA